MRTLFAVALALAASHQPAGDRVLYVYRDLLNPRESGRAETVQTDRCGGGNGPFLPLTSGAPADQAEIARQIDAAGVPALIDRALQRARRVLPGASVTICAFAGENTGGLPYLDGVGGVSLGAGRIKLFLHPAPKNLARIEYAVAHEYHHEVERLRGPAPRAGALNTVVREGKADNFAVLLYPSLRPPHTEPLTDAELRASWTELMQYESHPEGFGSGFMIGRFPNGTRWPGYRLGFELVEAYIRSRRETPAEWIAAPADAVVAQFRHTSRYRSAIGRSDVKRPVAPPRLPR
jgi:uncharacterized protein YjaZ